MKHYQGLQRTLSSTLLFLFIYGLVNAQGGDSLSSVAYFSLDECYATFNDASNLDYSEMTAEVSNGSACAQLEIDGGYLYRELPFLNPHSCTPGVGDSPAMCVGAETGCSYNSGTMKDIIIEVIVTPGITGSGTLSTLQFYEQAPDTFAWINGNSGPNNNPTLFAVRVLKEGEEVFLMEDIPTEETWNLRTFDFSTDPDFTVTEETAFRIELVAYCPNDNGSNMSVWDIDEVYIISACCEGQNGGTLDGGPFSFCVGDSVADMVSGITLSGNVGDNSQWIITDTVGTILGLPANPEDVNFDEAGTGVCLIWNISYADGLEGLETGNNALIDLVGCFDLSNAIEVVRNQPAGGVLTGGPFIFCVGDSIPDMVSGIELTENVGPNSQWVITDENGVILSLPPHPDSVNFDEAGAGTCLIWHLSFADSLSGAEVGNNAMTDLEGCFSLSNPIEVVRNQPMGGTLTGGPFVFCVGDSVPDIASGITLSGNAGDTSVWIITDTAGLILSLPSSPDSVDFDGASGGICLIWSISYSDSLSGLEVGNNAATDLEGCFSLSNPIEVIRNQPIGGELAGGPFDFCVGDSIPDMTSGITLTGNAGDSSVWVVTDTNGVILGLPPHPDSIDFDMAGPGVCLIWSLSYVDTLQGVEMGNSVSDIVGCFSLSNPVEVIRTQPAGGLLTGGPFEFCVGNGEPDTLFGVELTGASGYNFAWIVTDTNGIILSLPPSLAAIDFDGAGPGVCLVWHLSYGDTIGGLEVGNNAATDLVGCFSLSNALEVTRTAVSGGQLSGGPFEFCVGDGIPDYIDGVEVSGTFGDTSLWLITDTTGLIIGIPARPDSINFDEFGAGVAQIWFLSGREGFSGAQVGGNVSEMAGCFGLSNAVLVIRNQPEGGVLNGPIFEFCVGDGIVDTVSGIELLGSSGPNSQWIITDVTGTILALPPNPEAVDFDGAGSGVCYIRHISYVDSLIGLEIDSNVLTDLVGCYSLSNQITVIRNQPDGGMLTGGPFEFCVGDGEPDTVSGLVLTGQIGPNSQWVITDSLGVILGLPADLANVNFDEAGLGLCLIWHLSYFDTLEGLVVGNNALTDLSGCFDFSGSIEVVRLEGSDCPGINSNDDEMHLSVYPNPASGQITLSMENIHSDQVTIEIFDSRGVLRSTREGFFTEINKTIDVSNLDPGQYYIRVKGRDRTALHTFVVL